MTETESESELTDDRPSDADAPSIRGRTILVAVGVSVVLTAGILGLFVGALGAEQLTELVVFNLFAVPMTPLWVAGYAMAATTTVLIVLFGVVAFAAQFDTRGDEPT